MKKDIFIAHASEDKIKVAKPLADLLLKIGVSVWFDEYSLSIGDSLNEKIEEGLSNCSFGVIILSRDFFTKKWPRKELNALSTIELHKGKLILPLWHNVTHENVLEYSPTLADKVSIDTEKGLDYIANKISEEVVKREKPFLDYTEKGKINISLLIGWGLGYVELFGDNLDLLGEDDQERIRVFQNDIVDLTKHEDIVISYDSWKQFTDRLVIEYSLNDRLKHAFVLTGIGACRLHMAKHLAVGESRDEMLILAEGCFSRIDDGIIKRANLIFYDLQNKRVTNPSELGQYIQNSLPGILAIPSYFVVNYQ